MTYSFSYLEPVCCSMSSSNCFFLTCIQVSQKTSQVVLVFPSLSEFSTAIVIHTVKGFGIVNKAEIDVFLELSCFFNDPANVGNLISDFSAFSKTSLNIWKFMVHVLLKCVSCDRWRRSAAEKTYPTSKVRRRGCALLEQPWRDTACPR